LALSWLEVVQVLPPHDQPVPDMLPESVRPAGGFSVTVVTVPLVVGVMPFWSLTVMVYEAGCPTVKLPEWDDETDSVEAAPELTEIQTLAAMVNGAAPCIYGKTHLAGG
jgi:hypothetical protein